VTERQRVASKSSGAHSLLGDCVANFTVDVATTLRNTRLEHPRNADFALRLEFLAAPPNFTKAQVSPKLETRNLKPETRNFSLRLVFATFADFLCVLCG
jgi:hypothetical protein